jgi:hypothetical protein
MTVTYMFKASRGEPAGEPVAPAPGVLVLPVGRRRPRTRPSWSVPDPNPRAPGTLRPRRNLR